MATLFDLPEYKHLQTRWMARLREFTARGSYYDGTAYGDAMAQLGWIRQRFYKEIKPLYLPLSRAVNVDAGIIPGGWALSKDAPEAWQEALDTVFGWSSWKTQGVLFVHNGAKYGVVGIKVIDWRDKNIVMVKPISPTNFILEAESDYDDTPKLAIQIEIKQDADGTAYEYAEVYTPDIIRTYRDGVLTGFNDREPEYKNELGFVPFVEVNHIEAGDEFGESTYQMAIPLLNEVNETASHLARIIKKHSEPQWAVSGAEGGDLEKSGNNIWYLPQGAKADPLIAGTDIAGILEFVREIRDQVRGALPELSFDDLRQKDQIATATLELQLMELVLKIKRIRPNYDDGLAKALRMAGLAAGQMGRSEAVALFDEAFEFDQTRAVLPSDPKTDMELEQMALTLEREKALGYAES